MKNSFTRLLRLSLGALAAIAAAAAYANIAEVEPNGTRAQAQVLNAGADPTVNGTISATTDHDFYKVASVPVGECVTFFLQPNASSNYDITLSNSADQIIDTSTNGVGQLDVVMACNISGPVYAHVKWVSGLTGASGTYTLEATN